MKRSLYSETIHIFLSTSDDELLGSLIKNYAFPMDVSQKNAYRVQLTRARQGMNIVAWYAQVAKTINKAKMNEKKYYFSAKNKRKIPTARLRRNTTE